jgi:GNAT superfamily N-acetyltransferase
MDISELKHRQDLLPIAADRIWTAWWAGSGVSPAELETRLREVAWGEGAIFSLVAHDCAGFAGTASVIPSDIDERPAHSPWVAAVWVEEDRRGMGIGSQLVREAMQLAFARGAPQLFLCARPALVGFYQRLGWSVLEEGVGPDSLTIFIAEREVWLNQSNWVRTALPA